MRLIQTGFVLFATIVLCSCVPNRKYQEELAKRQAAEADLAKYKQQDSDCESKLNEANEQLTDFKKQVSGLQGDTSGCGMRYRLLSSQYDQLTANYELLLKQNKELMARQTSENNQLVGKLNMTQEQLIAKEDSLQRLDLSLHAQKRTLDSLTAELMKRELRVRQLESVLSSKDSADKALKDKLVDALRGFEGKGLTIVQKNGKVYVSMEDKLLFASGSYKVSTDGEKALKQLANVLAQNTDINVTIEGHTDDVPYNGSGDMKDNWDLSAIRATSVLKIILHYGDGKIDPIRLTASGKGEYDPVDPEKTTDARAKNRRTDIILTPKLDELLKILDNNG